MKKLIVLALAAMPFFAVAQEKTTSGAVSTAAKTGDNKFAIENPEIIFIELISSTNSAGVQTIKADFGRELVATLADKELSKQLMELRTMTYPTMPDAMNYFATLGFKFQQNYESRDKEGKIDTHFVYEKRIPRKPTGDVTTKPRPVRPESDRPNVEAKPSDKSPQTKPVERPKK